MKRYIYIIFGILMCNYLTAQDETTEFVMPDSMIVSYHYVTDMDTSYIYKDIDLDNYFHQYDPSLHHHLIYQNLGNAGSAATPIIFVERHKVGFSSGFRQYNLYRKTVDNLKIYDGNVPMLTAKFSPITDETNFIIQADFGRRFTDNTKLSINYNRIKQKGIYANQDVFNTNLGAVFSIGEKNDAYQAAIIGINNAISESQNGGIANYEELSNDAYERRALVTTRLKTAGSRYQERLLSYKHSYQIASWMSLENLLSYRSEYYKYYDKSVPNEEYYGSFITDERGVRYKGEFKTKEISGGIAIDRPWVSLNTGLRYASTAIDDENYNDHCNELQLYAIGRVPLGSKLDIDINGKLGLLDDGGEFDLSGDVAIDFGKFAVLSGGVLFYRHSPNFIEEHFTLTTENIWTNNWSTPYGFNINGRLYIPFLKANVGISQTFEDNSIYFEADRTPHQYSEAYSVTTLDISHRLDFFFMHLENDVMLQYASENLYGLPELYFRHHFFMEHTFFSKNMLARLGADFRHIPDYKGQKFTPFTGQFHRSDLTTLWYPDMDIYFSAQVEEFRVFAMYENALSHIRTYPSFPVHRYPANDGRLRFGISWRFFN